MKKKISIILIKDYLNIGNKGDIAEVRAGYAFNYLVPYKIAEITTENKVKHLQMIDQITSNHIKANEITKNRIKQKLENLQKISIYRKKGKNNYIFGQVTEKDISIYVLKYAGIKLDKKQIKIPNIKQLGAFTTQIKLSNNINLNLKLNILPVNT
uniref:Large ribosomal subunit protein bL9c n=1 Tax=Bostrychia tenella TaxID=324755 RepID=A0A1Z1M5I3_9FLOR|nr:ribosomal protein L9 [Bostrychia tenella]ARW61327.1 ribosomal protein L9 [Bostrychia tenella]